MLKEEISKIKVGDMEYPIHCGLLALETIQEEFKTLEEFEYELLPATKENNRLFIPNPHAAVFGATTMVNEGIEIWNRKTQMEKLPKVDKGIFLEADVNLYKLAEEIHNEFMRCFESKKEEAK